ncbi:MAG: hypothetical protein NTW29_06920 [Bacteroidetes bacterium]|nr:hypothetical protein [Bacteroidota bacterium]
MLALLQDKYYPITSSVVFMETGLENVCIAFYNWQQKLISDMASGYSLDKKEIRGTLDEALSTLLPLYTHEPRRHLFVPTRSSWVACFNNFVLGTDGGSLTGYLSTILQCRSLLIQSVEDTLTDNGPSAKRRYGAMVFDLHGPVIENYQNTIRKISLVNEGKKWIFYQQGEALPFENTSQYTEKLVKNKFNQATLHKYATEMGLDPFNPAFYLPTDGPAAVLIEKNGPLYPGMKSVALDEI